MDKNRFFIFAWNKDDTFFGIPHIGFYDDSGYYQKGPKADYDVLEKLKEFDYIQIFGPNGFICHIPTETNNDVLNIMKRVWVNYHGTEVKLF